MRPMLAMNYFVCILTVSFALVWTRNFTIDYTRDTFLKDGEPFRYISGSIHYVRVPRMYWKDRLLKMAAAGLNTIQTYVPWNYHQQKPNISNFSGNLDMEAFIRLAQDLGFLVILRPGPYTDAGWDFGGLAAWLMESTYVNRKIKLRTNNPVYMAAVENWFADLLPIVKPLLYTNGGPIIAVQVENEYGFHYSCDHAYLRRLRNLMRSYLGSEVVLFTVDGASASSLKCGTVEGLYSTIDFGVTANPKKNFAIQRKFEQHGPLVCTEFYVETTLDYWGTNHSVQSPSSAANGLDLVLATGANVNMYMFEGGTSFGFANGVIMSNGSVRPVTTTYDHDAALSEAGDIREKYNTIRQVILKYVKPPTIPVPSNIPKFAYGKIEMKKIGSVLDVLSMAKTPYVKSLYPMCMEDFKQYYGFALYCHVAETPYINKQLRVPGVRDRGYVVVNNVVTGIVIRGEETSLNLTIYKGDILNILVENQGHIYFGGKDMDTDQKGIVGNVTIGSSILKHWTMFRVNIDETLHSDLLSRLKIKPRSLTEEGGRSSLMTPSIYSGSFVVPQGMSQPMDTFIDMRPWHKGQFYINGHNVGRYWPVLGPQVTLYVPSSFLLPRPHLNIVTVLELEFSPCETSRAECFVKFVDKPFINKTVTP